MDIIALVSTLGGIVTGGGLVYISKAGRRKATAEAVKTEAEAEGAKFELYQQRIDELHKSLAFANEHITTLTKADSEKELRFIDQTKRLRDTQRQLVAATERAMVLERENGRLRLLNEFLRNWHCRREFRDCVRRLPRQKNPCRYLPPLDYDIETPDPNLPSEDPGTEDGLVDEIPNPETRSADEAISLTVNHTESDNPITEIEMIILIDNGHGSDTLGKCSPDGKYKEYAWAREMAGMIKNELVKRGYDARLLVPETNDIPLDRGSDSRVARVNRICNQHGAKNVLLVSIHSNANSSDGKWHDGKWSGFQAEVSKNASAGSKLLADKIWARAIEAGLKGNRSVVEKPGQRFIVQNLAICRETKCVAVLTESAFHDTHDGVKTLLERKQSIMLAHVEGIVDYIKTLK